MEPSPSPKSSSRREALFVAVTWLLSCGYIVGYAAAFAYRGKSADALPPLVFGMPSWVFWGVLAPWGVITAVTLWFAARGMKDEELGEERAGAEAVNGEAA